ncbi:MAG: hypothetical protein WCJ62_07485 [Flavobacterium sp.]
MAKKLTKLQMALKIQHSGVVINEILHYEKNIFSKEDLAICMVLVQQAQNVLELKKEAIEYGKAKK